MGALAMSKKQASERAAEKARKEAEEKQGARMLYLWHLRDIHMVYGIWIPRDASGTGLGQVVAFTSDEDLSTPSTTPAERLTAGPWPRCSLPSRPNPLAGRAACRDLKSGLHGRRFICQIKLDQY
jgi:hypothetical protein